MSVNTNNAGNKPNLTTPIAVVVGIAVLIFVIWWGYKNFGPEKAPPTAASNSYDAWFDKVAKESGGDISKLSQADAGKLQSQTLGHGAQALSGYAKQHGYAK